MVTLTDELSRSSASIAEVRFAGHGVSQTFASRERFFWQGLDRADVRSREASFSGISA